MRSRIRRSGAAAAVALGLTAALLPPAATAGEQDKVLKVCEDPNNLPFSSRNLNGFENRIADLLGRELGWKVEYTWYPQRMGFIRNTLRARLPDSKEYKCDLVIGVPAGFEMGATTRSYYRSTYAMSYVKGKGLDEVHALEDLLKLDPAKRKSLKLGVFARSPVLDWLLKHDMIDQIVSYQTQSGDPDQYPGEIVEKDLAQGKIDIAFVWGPIAGYFAKQSTAVPIAAVPLKSNPDARLDFSIVMAVRHGDKEFRDRIDGVLAKHSQEVQQILTEYGVPLVNERGELIAYAPAR